MSDSATARAWLEAREPDIPGPLRERMRAALSAAATGDGPATDLAQAALDCLRAALDAGDGRGAALHLLAADALITHAAEAAAMDGEDALRQLESTLGAAALGRRFLPEARP